MNQEFDWSVLLFQLADRKIVPVIGKELLKLCLPNGEQLPIEQWLVRQLIEKFSSDIGDMSEFNERMSINEFTLAYMNPTIPDQREIRKRMIQREISRLMTGAMEHVPESLKKLAEIEQFELFISTTPDTLIDKAITTARGACKSRAYKLRSEPEDIDTSITETTTYHVFGTFDDNQDFAVTDEDMVEFLHRISTVSEPRNLSDYLSDKSLLLIGCGLPKALVPYLARTLASKRLFPSTGYRIIDRVFSEDPEIVLFWRGFSGEALIGYDANQFVDELYERWKRDVDPTAKTIEDRIGISEEAEEVIPALAENDVLHVFVSYRHDDKPATEKIVEALKSRKIEVWYDHEKIRGGDDWEREIKTNIDRCTLFMPVLSKHSQSDENVLIKEWNLALERRERINKLLPFIVPVVIDEEIGPGAEYIYPEFWETDTTKKCIDGVVPKEFLDDVQEQIKKRIKASKGRS